LQMEMADLQFDKDARNTIPYIWVIDFYKKYLPADNYPVHTVSDHAQQMPNRRWGTVDRHTCEHLF
jgi:hypothetical protein